MIDADPGLDYQSPYYNEREEDIEDIQQCHWCDNEYPESEFEFYTNNNHPVCDCCKNQHDFEGLDYKKDFYKDAKEWVDETVQLKKDIREFDFGKTKIEKENLTLF